MRRGCVIVEAVLGTPPKRHRDSKDSSSLLPDSTLFTKAVFRISPRTLPHWERFFARMAAKESNRNSRSKDKLNNGSTKKA